MVCDPEFSGLMRLWIALLQMYSFTRVYEMMVCQVKCAFELLSAVAERMDSVNLQLAS